MGPLRPSILDDANLPMFTVGQVAQILGVQPAFVRRLDSEQVVSPNRSSGGQRRYSRNEIDQVQAVSTMAGSGMSLAGIRRILELEGQLAVLQAQLADLQARLDGA